MELDDLKKAWGDFSSKSEKQMRRTEDELAIILQKRTIDIRERIGRNIRIGIGIVIGWVLLGITTDFITTPFFDKILDKPYLKNGIMNWTMAFELIIYLLIIAAILLFWSRYKKVEKSNIETNNLHDKITQLIRVINSYKKMFYTILVLVLLYVVTTFSLGFFMEYNFQMNESGIDPSTIANTRKAIVFLTFSLSISIILGIYYILFQFFFKRLYGRHLKQLNATLSELNESDQNQ